MGCFPDHIRGSCFHPGFSRGKFLDLCTTITNSCHEQENGRTEMDSQGRISKGEEGRTEEQRKQRNAKKSCFDGYFCRCLASSYKVYLTTLLRHSWAYNLGRSWANTITQPILWNSNQPLNGLAACCLLRVRLVMTFLTP